MGFEPIGFVLERVYDLLKHEASILLEDEKELIQSLQNELEFIESYLKDMDDVQRRSNISNALKTKIQHLVLIIGEIEDFLDNIIDQKAQQSEQTRWRDRVKACFSCTTNPLIQKHRLVEEVAQIRQILGDTLQRPHVYQLPNNSLTLRSRPPTNSWILKDEIIIGLEENVETLIANFMGKGGKDSKNSSIVGMGGSGKTTLAKKFYNHTEIKNAFSRRAWVCVSQEWNADQLLIQICVMFGVQLSEDERSFPRFKLQKFFEEEKGSCLVVLDDVWEKTALQELLPTLLSGNGRVLITTRKERIVKFPTIGAFYIHTAPRLTPEQSWDLFSRIVRNSCDGAIDIDDVDYMSLGKEMLAKCDGLPLAIITLAGLLGTKRTIQQWEKTKDSVISKIMSHIDNASLDSEGLKKVLELSYFDLPYYIKPCFLYLGSFIEDYIIHVRELIHLWIQEGFIKADQFRDRRRLEEVAMDILEEFVQRCMVQVVLRDYAGDLIFIRLHDLMRDLCIDNAKESGFFEVLSTSAEPTSAETKPQCHRAIIHDRKTFVLNNPRLRTLNYVNRFSQNQLPTQLFPFERLKQLRVMCLVKVELGDSAKHIGNMVLLRYLRLSQCKYQIENMDFIKKLRNLRTLLIEMYPPMNRDATVGRMKYNEVFQGINIDAVLLGVSNCRNLEFFTAPGGQWLIKELQPISINLRNLNICDISSLSQLDVIYNCVFNPLARIEALTLDLNPEEDRSNLAFDLEKMKLERCQLLKRLQLNGKMKNQHEKSWLFPPNLLLLRLLNSHIEEEEVMKKIIDQLDHLRLLCLDTNSYLGDKLTISGLSQLQGLNLHYLPNLKDCKISESALPQLRQLYIRGCTKLERLPVGISNIGNLQLLTVIVMPEIFCIRYQDGGEDFSLVQHIPKVEYALIDQL